MYDWDDLKVFLAAWRRGSLSKAAESLDVSLSTASRRLGGFEETLGVVLFSRTPDGLIPTDAARRIVASAEAAERMARDVSTLVHAGSEEPVGLVRVAMPGDVALLVLMPHLAELLAGLPGLRVALEESVETADVLRREVDITVRVVPPQDSEELIGRRIRTVRWVLAANHAMAGSLEAPVDLTSLPWVALPPNVLTGAWLEQHLEGVQPVLSARTAATVRHAILAGVGVGLVPWSFVVATPGLVEVPSPVPLPPPLPLWMVAHRAARDVPAVNAVWEMLAESLTSKGAERDADLLRSGVARAYGWV